MSQFNHSEKVPQIYKLAAKCLQQFKEKGGSLKELVFNQRSFNNIKGIYALVTKTVQNYSQINDMFDKVGLLTKETRFNPWLARILATQLLWSDNGLCGNCTPIKIILSYRSELEKYANSNLKGSSRVMKPRYVRVNTFALTVDEAINGFINEGWEFVEHCGDDYNSFIKRISSLQNGQFMLDLHIKELLVFSHKTELYNHETYKSKSIFLQDKASCIPVHLLNPTPGSVVLDMCAAPGLKTIFLAERLQNKGTVYAVERDQNRYNTLTSMINESGATCIKTIHKDVLEVSAEECPNVEYILVDPSCSGSGIVDRVNIDEVTTIDEARISKLANFQILLLKHALTKFPKAKRVVYSTCSIYSKENDYVVSEVLKNRINFKLISTDGLLKHTFLNTFKDNPDNDLKAIRSKCVYTIPERDLTNGFFVAVFERTKEWVERGHNENNREEFKNNEVNEEAMVGLEESSNKKKKKRDHATEESLDGKRHESSTSENIDSFQEETEEIPKKTKKNHPPESCEVVETSANLEENSTKKKKKKKIIDEEPTFVISSTNDDDSHVSKKKKGELEQSIQSDQDFEKKKKKSKMSISESITINCGAATVAQSEEISRKTKKAKRSGELHEVVNCEEKGKEKSTLVGLDGVANENDEGVQESRKKKKRKRATSEDTEGDAAVKELRPQTADETQETLKRKKRKEKESILEDYHLPEANKDLNSNSDEKSHKKKKKRKHVTDEIPLAIPSEEDSLIFSKKKKKTKGDPSTDDIHITHSIEEISDQNLQQAHKKKKKTEEINSVRQEKEELEKSNPMLKFDGAHEEVTKNRKKKKDITEEPGEQTDKHKKKKKAKDGSENYADVNDKSMEEEFASNVEHTKKSKKKNKH
ncbi:hypothetical protein PPYR_12195 [Photinus pyralis]|uniref:SAM-dependent MTase RsmB/NOP-type domain-containing protein n=1 Tax=Photinus pyralis TaxID=7054 RepID=A0A5N4ADF9_PHOPY|nr:hypothetical protein PPYR_12195 [Photinus pyralis]